MTLTRKTTCDGSGASELGREETIGIDASRSTDTNQRAGVLPHGPRRLRAAMDHGCPPGQELCSGSIPEGSCYHLLYTHITAAADLQSKTRIKVAGHIIEIFAIIEAWSKGWRIIEVFVTIGAWSI